MLDRPKNLIVQTVRVTEENPEEKIHTAVEFNLNLDMTAFMQDNIESNYKLFGVINHQGTTSKGHYVSIVKHGDQWIRANDADVQLETEDVIRLYETRTTTHVLFFSLEEH